jgi:hypothetical protein
MSVVPADRAQPRALEDVLAGIVITYRPVWYPGRNVISAYHCLATLPSAEIDVGSGEARPLRRSPDAITRLDRQLQEAVIAELAELVSQQRPLILQLPVHFETIAASGSRRQYLEGLQLLPAEARKLLVVELVDLPPGAARARILDLVSTLRSCCRAVIIRQSIDGTDLQALRGCGGAAVGCSLMSLASGEATLMPYLERFAKLAEKAGLAAYVRGARSLSLVAATLGAGYSFIDGDGIGKPVAKPTRILDFQLLDVYRPLLGALSG